jgi:hypothetical protein
VSPVPDLAVSTRRVFASGPPPLEKGSAMTPGSVSTRTPRTATPKRCGSCGGRTPRSSSSPLRPSWPYERYGRWSVSVALCVVSPGTKSPDDEGNRAPGAARALPMAMARRGPRATLGLVSARCGGPLLVAARTSARRSRRSREDLRIDRQVSCAARPTAPRTRHARRAIPIESEIEQIAGRPLRFDA